MGLTLLQESDVKIERDDQLVVPLREGADFRRRLMNDVTHEPLQAEAIRKVLLE